MRQAFNLAANTPAAVESAYQGAYPAATSAISSGTPFYTDKFANLYPHDVAKAEKLLDEAGWKQGANGVREKNGKPLTVKEPMALATLLAHPDDYVGKTVQVKGKITEVCQMAGCW